MFHLTLTVFLMVSVTQFEVQAAEGAKAEGPKQDSKTNELPPPTPVAPVTSQLLPYYLPSSLPRPGTREVWQYYGVDNRGRWVPRVIMAPGGSYYLYNGAPFPYTNTQPSLVMPYVLD